MPIPVSIIVNDSPVRELLVALVNFADGFNCISQHCNARSALLSLAQEKPAIVLVDIKLPDLGGLECVRRVSPLMPGTQFVLLIDDDSSEDQVFQILAAGAIGCLSKQALKNELVAALKQICDGGSPMTNQVARKLVVSLHRSQETARVLNILTQREQQVLGLIARGHTNRKIAKLLDITRYTVDTYVNRLYKKLQVRSRTQAMAKLMDLSSLPNHFVITRQNKRSDQPVENAATSLTAAPIDAMEFLSQPA
jgi:DNA-binding NarL/FixJ family response regulator